MEPVASPATDRVSDNVFSRTKALLSEVFRDARGVETDPRPTPEHIQAAVRWLYLSQDVTGVGGSASNYNLVLGWGGPYPETTGYIIPTLYDYSNRWGSGEARNRARRMADWLLETQRPNGGFPADDGPENAAEPSVFNTGQILFGLVRTAEETDDDRYLEAATRASRWLVEVQHEDGYWDRYDYRSSVHAYSSRIAWGLLSVYERTGETAFRDAAAANLSWVADRQREDGWFEYAGFEEGEDPFLHTIAYTIRGLLEGGNILGDDEAIAAARTTADTLLAIQNDRGILRGRFDAAFQQSKFYCLTGNAQMAVVWYRLFELTGDPAYREAADETVAFLKRHQRLDGPPAVRGGLKGSAPVWGVYMYFRYPNWAAKYLLDSLLLAQEHET